MDHRPDFLDHQEVFETITFQLITPLGEKIDDHNTEKKEALQKFLALFYGRCVETNVDTSFARPIIEQVLLLDRPELVMMVSPVFLRLLIMEEVKPGISMELITDPHVIEDCPKILTKYSRIVSKRN